MEAKYSKRFLKDLARIEPIYREKIEKVVFNNDFCDNPFQSGILEKLSGYSDKYKIRIGSYRIGITIEKNVLRFERAVHRSKIYRNFP